MAKIKMGETFFGTLMRLNLFRLLSVVALLLLVFVKDTTLNGTLKGEIFALLGLLLMSAGMLGRAFCAVYIEGRKLNSLVTEGPYSISRNPLYFFSFLGGVGIGLAGQNLIVFVLLLIAFLLYYPGVMRREEWAMELKHGEPFLQYKSSTPLFFPRFSTYQEPDTLTIKTPYRIRKAFREVFFFSVTYAVFWLIAKLHTYDIISPLVTIGG